MNAPFVRRRSLVAFLLALSACSDPAAPEERAPERITELPRPLAAAERRAAQGTTHFALGLFRRVAAARPTENTLLSPFSVAMALGLLTQATDGSAHAALRDSLGFAGMSREEVGAAYRDLVPMLRGLDPRVRLTIANGIFVQNGFPLEPAFVSATARDFSAPARNVDFTSSAGFDAVNRWASESTSGRIGDIVSFVPDVMAILANAVHFDADWRSRFDAGRTAPAPFSTAAGTTVQPPTMRSAEIGVRHAVSSDAEIVELPYGGDAWAMTIVLPPRGTSIQSLVASLDTARWNRWTRTLVERKATVTMPKYAARWRGDLLPTLETAGVLPGRARGAFRPMTPAYGNLEVGFVNHATWMQVDERGTEAAAVTAVGVTVTCACPAQPLNVVVDRPFLVAIRERFSGTVLFLGQVTDPTR